MPTRKGENIWLDKTEVNISHNRSVYRSQRLILTDTTKKEFSIDDKLLILKKNKSRSLSCKIIHVSLNFAKISFIPK